MSISKQLAKHVRDVHFGGNWTCVNLKDTLDGIDWEMANARVGSFNTIVTLVYHMHYYVGTITKVLQEGPLTGKDEESFVHPPLRSEQEWQDLQQKVWRDAEVLALLIEDVPDSKLTEDFTDKKYGTYFRNLQGFTEHTHYHLGQIALIKKILAGKK